MKTPIIIVASLLMPFLIFAQTCPPPASIQVGTSCSCHNCSGIDVVNFETYVKRVLNAEWFPCWGSLANGMNSLQAGAVAIRGYTISRMNNQTYINAHNSGSYNICSTTCCQAYSTSQTSNPNNAVDNTYQFLLTNGSGTIMLSEYAAENNNHPNCSDGQKGDGSGSWPCTSDAPCTGKTYNGHGRGMCQWGSARWATGDVLSSGGCSLSASHGYGTKTWQQILAHYYPNWTLNNCNGGSEDIIVSNTSATPNNVDCTVEVTADQTYSGNQLDADLPSFDLEYYLSTDCTYDGGDVLLGNDVSGLGSDDPVNSESSTLTIPGGTSSGTYYILFVADADNELTTEDENNNVACEQISINCSGQEDITVNNTSVSPTTVACGSTVDVQADHVYSGNQLSSNLPDFDLDYYLSSDCNYSSGDQKLGSGSVSSLGSNDPVENENYTLTIPNVPGGTYYILFVADAANGLAEVDENNNVACEQITVNCIVEEDITVINTSVSPATVDCDNTVDVQADHVYLGSLLDADLPSFDIDYYLSSDCNYGGNDVLLEGDVSGLGSDDPVNTESATLTIPAGTPGGTYYILFVGDADGELTELDENNNITCEQITVNCVNPCTYTITPPNALNLPSTGASGSFTVTPSPSTCSWTLDSSPSVCIAGATFSDLSGTGEVTISYTIPPNATSTLQTCTLTVQGTNAKFIISQLPAPPTCTLTLSSSTQNSPPEGGSNSFTVTASDPNCDWSVSSGCSWVVVTSPSGGTGTGTEIVEYEVEENSGSITRNCIISFNDGQIFTIDQLVGIDIFESLVYLNIFPNPNTGSFTIQLETRTQEEIQISVLNILGQSVYQAIPEQAFGEYSKSVELNSVASGVYFVKVRVGDEFANQKIIVR